MTSRFASAEAHSADSSPTPWGTTPTAYGSVSPVSADTAVPDRAIAAEQPTTFEELLTPLLDPAYGLALTLTGNRADAQDLVQEAALAALRGFSTFQPGSNFKAWFYRVLTNCFYAKHRRQKRRPQTVGLDDVPDLYMYARTIEAGLHRQSDNPAELLMDRINVEQVQHAIEALPDEYRSVAGLYFMEDLTYEEIAEVLACPVGTVRSRLHRARRMLQKVLWHIATEEGIVNELTREGTTT